MGIIRAFEGAISGTFADQWKDIITVNSFDEHTVVAPGYLKSSNNGRGTNFYGSDGVISNGSKIYVPENTAAYIFSQSGIEEIITVPGGYEYQNGTPSLFNGDGVGKSIFGQVADRVGYGGMTPEFKQIAFVNLREIRDIKFGTKGAQVYNDIFYGVDLEVFAYGSFSVRVVDSTKFIRNFVPANVTYYSFDDQKVRAQILAEFLQSFIVALNSLSSKYRVSQIPSQANSISQFIANDEFNAGTWEDRFGFKIISVAIENIELTEDSRNLIKQYSSNKMGLSAYEDVSEKASNIAAQQKIAEGIKDNGFGNVGGMIMGMNMAQAMGPMAQQPMQSPQQPMQSPQQPMQSPQQPMQSPQQPMQSPQQPMQSLQQPMQSPQQPMQSPQQPTQSPQQPMQSPQQSMQSMVTPPPIPQQSKFHVVLGGEAAGPFELSVIKQMISEGKVLKDTFVWKEGMDNWEKAIDIEEVKKLFSQTPPPIPKI